MCLGIPMKVIKIEGQFAWVKTGGLRRKANIQLVPKVMVGDYVIVHAGFAIQIINQEVASQTLRLVDEIH